MSTNVDTITQIDVILAEDGQTVLLNGWTPDDKLYIQSFALPARITEEAFDLTRDEWRNAYRPNEWRLVP
jgi:hypothetical protein